MEKLMTYEEFLQNISSIVLTKSGNCPVTPVVEMIQGKWKLQILYALCIQNPRRFGELKKFLQSVTHAALTNALKELEADGFIIRTQYNEIPPRVEYSLSDKGKDLLPIFYSLANFGLKYID
ncbi:HxlR family transcriptional regulator [Gallibacterium salpingitidis]|uniref:HxlR family transcriptional regulator n=2 Tax=Gallibacterium salpingitidis TaxID=505341 RepID=A0AB36E094_9PAST|nr:HxlR family transcriptional regulator [Gallibacterium salpingitidis]